MFSVFHGQNRAVRLIRVQKTEFVVLLWKAMGNRTSFVDCENKLWHNHFSKGKEGNEYICASCQRVLQQVV
jgi:hypothetical protein